MLVYQRVQPTIPSGNQVRQSQSDMNDIVFFEKHLFLNDGFCVAMFDYPCEAFEKHHFPIMFQHVSTFSHDFPIFLIC